MAKSVDSDVPKNPLLRWGAYAGAVIAIIAALSGVWAMTGNDAPPLASINRVDELDKRTMVAQNKSDKRIDALLGAVSSQSNVMLQIQLRACQRDRQGATDDQRRNPDSSVSQEALDEANDCIRSLTRQINRPQ